MDYIRADEYCDLVTDGTHDSPSRQDSGYYLITSKHIKGADINYDDAYMISEEDYKKIIQRSKVDQWDILISMIGVYCGFAHIVTEEKPNFAVKNVGILKTGSKSKAQWLYYYLSSPEGKNYLDSVKAGSTQPYISLSELRKMPIPMPAQETREMICAFLSTIDDKIYLNNQINTDLEQQAKNLFEYMFIANTERSKWEIGTFSNVIESTLGGDWGKDSLSGNNTEKVYCIRGADIPEVKVGNIGKMPIRYILPKNYENKRLLPGDIVVEISGGSPTQSTGRVCAISQALLDRYDNGMVCTNFCRALKPKAGYSMFVYYYWQYLYERNVFFSYENGTTGIKNLDLTGFITTEEIVIPPLSVVHQFDVFCQSILYMTFANGRQNEQLALLRDSLLPRLMTGEIDLSIVL